MKLPDVDYAAFIYPSSDSRHGLPRPTRRYAASGDPPHARIEYWFGGLRGWRSGDCTLVARTPGIWIARAPKRVLAELPIVGRFAVHELMADGLRQALLDIHEAGLAAQIDVANTRAVGGTYCCRGVRGGSTASPHAWAIAIDINPNHHLRGGKDVLDTSDTNYRWASPPSLSAIAPFFTRLGFAWGGHWGSPKDPMHFELTPLTLLILAGETDKLPKAYVERCQPESVKSSYPGPGTPVRVVQLPDKLIECEAEFDGEQVRCSLRKLAEALGFNVYDHILDQGKVYLGRNNAE